MSVKPLKEQHKAFMGGKIHACPLREHWTSFQLVDEFGEGEPYAGLTFEATDYEDMVYTGKLDASGIGKVEHHFNGPIVLTLSQLYQGKEKAYTFLRERLHYPLPITELQVRAEKTRFRHKSGVRTHSNAAKGKDDIFYQVEVSELVVFHAHLPPAAERNFPPNPYVISLFRRESQVKMQRGVDAGAGTVITSTDTGMAELGFAPPPPTPKVIALLPNRHHVLEVRPLRALRPALSTDNEFCALNLYQLALMATLSYSPFGQQPDAQPVASASVGFPLQPSSGNWFGEALPCFAELWKVDTAQARGTAYYPLYEEVPYSKRLEIMPFDPELYPLVNDPALGEKQENPANLHFFDDSQREGGTNTQAFITHHDELILIAVRGTAEGADILRDIDAEQVPFKEGVGKVHNGFYGAAKAIQGFVTDYLEKFHSGQKIVITGHSLGGAITLLLSEMLRRRNGFNYDILLYTYGSPRAADKTFVEGAVALFHHRTVNHNDPVPSVPATWMNTDKPLVLAGKATLILINPVVGTIAVATGLVNFTGRSYEHHGTLRHFMPVKFEDGHESSVLWTPMCSSITDQGCAKALSETDGLPVRGNFLHQILNSDNHMMVASYIPNCWASLRRWQESQELKRPLITDREFNGINAALERLTMQLRQLERHSRIGAHDDGYDRDEHERALIIEELTQIKMTQKRLITLRVSSVAESEVYGCFANKPELLAETLPRWKAHPENIKQEQLAMIPPAADTHDRAIAAITGGHVVGSPFNLDVDALI